MTSYVIREIPVDRPDGQYLAHALVRVWTYYRAGRVIRYDDPDVTLLGLELPSGALTLLGPGWLLAAEAETATLAALREAEEIAMAEADRERDEDARRDEDRF